MQHYLLQLVNFYRSSLQKLCPLRHCNVKKRTHSHMHMFMYVWLCGCLKSSKINKCTRSIRHSFDFGCCCCCCSPADAVCSCFYGKLLKINFHLCFGYAHAHMHVLSCRLVDKLLNFSVKLFNFITNIRAHFKILAKLTYLMKIVITKICMYMLITIIYLAHWYIHTYICTRWYANTSLKFSKYIYIVQL